MKKKILGGSALLTIAAVAAWNVNLNMQGNDLSDASFANMEALAECEAKLNGDVIFTCSGSGTCSKTVKKWGQTFELSCDGTEN